MASIRQLGYYWGVLLPAVCDEMNIDKDKYQEVCGLLHSAFKEYLSIKSIAKLDTHRTEVVFSTIRMLMARERGMLLPLPVKEPGTRVSAKILHIMTMGMYLDYCKQNDH